MHSRRAQEQMPLDPFTIIASGAVMYVCANICICVCPLN